MSKAIKIHDHTPNSYGLVIYTPGIDFTRFDSNPVMLDSHDDMLILGKWSDKTIKDNEVFAMPVFNEQNDHAVSRMQEYDGGFLNGASIGIDFDWDDVQIRPDLGFSPEQPVLVKCSCYEASLCAIPSNASALQLKSGGEKLSPEQFKQKLTLKLSASAFHLSQKSHNMNLTLLKKQLSLDSATSDDAVIEMAMQRIADGEAAVKELGTLKLELQKKDEEQIELVVNEAKAQGKITDADVSDVKASLKLNFASGKKMLDLIPAKNPTGSKGLVLVPLTITVR